MNQEWVKDAIFYHIYPLGCFGAPRFAHEEHETKHRIRALLDWLPHFQEMHVNALYLGPIFASYEHGYDTSDYRCLDHRLGTNEDFKQVCELLHEAGIRIVLDGVFHHVGREFWAFRDLLEHKENSPYKDWFANVNFTNTSPYGDPFSYEAWEGHYNLVKLNLHNPEVVSYLLDSVGLWMDEFHIDGLRLDAANRIDRSFFKTLHDFTKGKNPHFWLMGEIIHGNYSLWANPDLLDSVTNYECYKGLYSAHNTKNYFEIAHSLHRQFGKGGIYESLHLYNFADNHDVNRLASLLEHEEDLPLIYTLLYTMPGIPSIYYGSEYGIHGTKQNGSDENLRPTFSLSDQDPTHPLYRHICQLGALRHTHCALRKGRYEAILVRNEQFIFARSDEQELCYIAFNIAAKPCTLKIENETYAIDLLHHTHLQDAHGITITLQPHECTILMHAEPNAVQNMVEEHKPREEAKEAHIQAPKQNEKPPLPTIPLGKYRHFKGKEYALLYLAYDSENLAPMVVYRQLYGEGSVWVRPLAMFCEEVESENGRVPRFTYIGK